LSKGDSLLGNPIHQAAASGGGNLTRFSWSVEGVGTSCSGHSWTTPVDLFIEGSGSIAGTGCPGFSYSDYIPAPEIFNDQKSHIVRMSKNQGDKGANGVFVFIYGN